MAKPRNRRPPTPQPRAPGDSPQPELPPGRPARRWRTLVLSVGFVSAFAWGLLCWRAQGHLREGTEALAGGRTQVAARAFESGVACYAPLNPYSRACAERLRELGSSLLVSDPEAGAEVEDRLRRSVRSLRWLRQPYPDLLEGGPRTAPAPVRDPSGPLYLASCLGLLMGLGAPWLPVKPPARWALGVAGWLLWGLLLYLC